MYVDISNRFSFYYILHFKKNHVTDYALLFLFITLNCTIALLKWSRLKLLFLYITMAQHDFVLAFCISSTFNGHLVTLSIFTCSLSLVVQSRWVFFFFFYPRQHFTAVPRDTTRTLEPLESLVRGWGFAQLPGRVEVELDLDTVFKQCRNMSATTTATTATTGFF